MFGIGEFSSLTWDSAAWIYSVIIGWLLQNHHLVCLAVIPALETVEITNLQPMGRNTKYSQPQKQQNKMGNLGFQPGLASATVANPTCGFRIILSPTSS